MLLTARIALLLLSLRPSPGPTTPDSAAIRRDVVYLASDALAGRGTGTPGNDSASAWIARRYAAMRIAPLGASGDAYFQPFTAHLAPHAGRPSTLETRNVVAV